MLMFAPVLAAIIFEGAVFAGEVGERHHAFAVVQSIARASGKPLLVIGRPRWIGTHPCGDVTVDIDPQVLVSCPTGGQVADVRDLPYPDQMFGAALCAHVLEHLPTPADARQALQELHRVAAHVNIVSPTRLGLWGWWHPDHHLWIDHRSDGWFIEDRSGQHASLMVYATGGGI